MRRLIKGLLLGLFLQSTLVLAATSNANNPPVYVKYLECTGEKGATLELYADTAGNAVRPALVTLYNFAYLGTANLDLTAFTGTSGSFQLSVSLQKDDIGHFIGGVI